MKTKKRVTLMVLDEQQTRTMEISPRLLRSIRPALVGLTLASITLACGLAYISWQAYEAKLSHAERLSENEELQQQVFDLQNATSAEIEEKLGELGESETSLQKLQKYLRDRGVRVKMVDTSAPKEKKNDAAGGPELAVAVNIPYTGSFKKDVDNLLKAVKKVPLGRPHSGSLSSRFGVRANPFTGKGRELHSGLDFRGKTGQNIRTTADGKVIFAGKMNGYGNLVKVRHGYGYETRYAHLSAISVKVGERVSAGDVVGKLGSTGRSTGPHLHYEVRLNGKPLDPESFLSLAAKKP